MSFTLTEKYTWDPSDADRRLYDFEPPPRMTSETVEPSDIDAASLCKATIAVLVLTLLVWLFASSLKWPYRWFVRGRRRYGGRTHAEPDQDSDGTLPGAVFDSPLSHPPAVWLRDVDVTDRAYVTPPPERLLFSVSPVPGQSALVEARHVPFPTHLPTMQSTAGQAGNQAAHLGAMRDTGAGARGITVANTGQEIGSAVGVGWSRDLMLRQAALLPVISSVEGLKGSAQFQEYIRSTPRGPLVAKQCQDKIETYQRLRQLDPDAFRQLFSRDDLQSYDARPPPLVLALADSLLGLLMPVVLVAALHWSKAAPLTWYIVLFIWLAVKLRLAVAGFISPFGSRFDIYLVYDTPDGLQAANGLEGLAGVGGHILLSLVEFALAMLSCGVLAVGTFISIAAGSRRQTLAMRLLRLRLEQEVCRRTRLSPYSPSSEKTSTNPYRTSGRYGLPSR